MNFFDKGFALIIGVARYRQINPLPTVVIQDAQDISTLLLDPLRGGYQPSQVRTLYDEKATAELMRAGLEWLAASVTARDTAIIFFSGHGGRLPTGGQTGYYLLPVDADPNDLRTTAVDSYELARFIQRIQAERLLILLDCCHAGGIGEVKETTLLPGFKAGFDEDYYHQLTSGQGKVIIASCKENEQSWIFPGIQNSLFTHFLLKALKGEAKTYGSGFVGVFDVFNYVAESVPTYASRHQRQQHPLLRATAESNFPLVLHGGGKEYNHLSSSVAESQEDSTLSASQKLLIQNPNDVPLSQEVISVFQVLFAKHERIIMETEFGQGFSGGRVFLIYPIRQGGTRELPVVVKVGAVSLIQKEWQAFLQFIRDRLPKSIGIQDQPVLPLGMTWGALRYAMAGDGEFPVASLRSYCEKQKLEDIQFVFEKQLLPTIDTLHRHHHVVAKFSIRDSFDTILPLNLLIEPITIPDGNTPFVLTPETYPNAALKAGDYVRLEGFIIVKVDLQDDTVTLNLPRTSSTVPPKSFTVRLNKVGVLQSISVNQVISPIEGIVKTIRAEQLQTAVKAAIGGRFRLEEDTVSLMDGRTFPNPVKRLPDILRQFLDVRVSTIHGDANIENILVHLDTRSISLIDFSEARDDYLLHDYWRLETEIVVKLVAASLAEANLGAGIICDFYQQLHNVVVGEQPASKQLNPALEKPFAILVALRNSVHSYLLKRNQWGEYYQGMAVYLLAALKFRSLDEEPSAPLPKQVAVWGSATLLALADNRPQSPIDGTVRNDQSPPLNWKFNWEKVRTRLSQDTRIQAKFVDTLLQCSSMSNRSDRDALVDKLPINLKVRIKRIDSARVDLVSIVSTSLVHVNGLRNLLEKLQEFEGNESLPLQDVNTFLNSL